GPGALPVGAVQSDRPFGDRRAQSRGHPPGRDDRLYRRFRADADRDPRLPAIVAAGPRPAPPAGARGGGRLIVVIIDYIIYGQYTVAPATHARNGRPCRAEFCR